MPKNLSVNLYLYFYSPNIMEMAYLFIFTTCFSNKNNISLFNGTVDFSSRNKISLGFSPHSSAEYIYESYHHLMLLKRKERTNSPIYLPLTL